MNRRPIRIITMLILILSLFILPACGLDNLADGDYNLIDEDEIIIQEPTEEPIDDGSAEEPVVDIIEKDKVILALGNINIRSTPSISESNIIGLFKKDSTLTLIRKYNDKWNIVDYKGKEAYISSSISYSKVIDSTQQVEINIIEEIIKAGMSQLGVKYEYGSVRILRYNGSVNPYFTGKTFDCSAFVQYAFYKGGGIKIQGDSRSQSRDGMEVALNNLKRGDLIFMTSSARYYNTGLERIGHVVIYLGNNKILHTYGTGGVRVQEYSAFWKDRAIIARRMA